ncbi:hypothetical protein D3C72_1359950 [compost metagenome]
MEKCQILPLHGLVALPLDGHRHGDAERVRIERIEKKRSHRHGGKDQQPKDGKQRPFIAQKSLRPLRRHAINDNGQSPDDRQVDGFHRHGRQGKSNEDAAKHPDEMQQHRDGAFRRQRPEGNVERPYQRLERAKNRI